MNNIAELITDLPIREDWRARALALYNKGDYTIHSGDEPPEPYNAPLSGVRRGWLVTSDSTLSVIMTFAYEERWYVDGLHLWYRDPTQARAAAMNQICKALAAGTWGNAPLYPPRRGRFSASL